MMDKEDPFARPCARRLLAQEKQGKGREGSSPLVLSERIAMSDGCVLAWTLSTTYAPAFHPPALAVSHGMTSLRGRAREGITRLRVKDSVRYRSFGN